MDGNIDRDFVATALRAVDQAPSDARRRDRHGRTAVELRDRGIPGDPRAPPGCRSSGAARFRPSCPEDTLNSAVRRLRRAGAGRGYVVELLDALPEQRAGARLSAIAGLSWRCDGQVVHNQERSSRAASLDRMLPYESLRESAAIPDPDLSGPAHRRLPGSPGLPVSLHVLRRRGDVSRQTALPPAARLEQDLRFLKDRLGRGRHPVLRPQLLRS